MKVLKRIHDGENVMSVDTEFCREFLVSISEPGLLTNTVIYFTGAELQLRIIYNGILINSYGE